MINDDVVPEFMQKFNFNFFKDGMWWFQDETPYHGPLVLRQRLRELFGDQIITLNHTAEWPARSPDLTPCDLLIFFSGVILTLSGCMGHLVARLGTSFQIAYLKN